MMSIGLVGAKAADGLKTFMEWLAKVNRPQQRLDRFGRSAGSNRRALGKSGKSGSQARDRFLARNELHSGEGLQSTQST